MLDKFIESSCSRKVKLSEKQAIAKAIRYGISFYKCAICGCYHLTSHKLNKKEISDKLN